MRLGDAPVRAVPAMSRASLFGSSSLAYAALLALASASLTDVARAQASSAALAFADSGPAPTSAVIAVDDDVAAGDLSAPCDVGAGGFTLELWIRGSGAQHTAPGAGGSVELPGSAWPTAHALLDRSLPGVGGAAFGVGIAGGRIRFYTGAGASGADAEHVLEGRQRVLDGAWHHVACVRDASSGIKSIYIDGALDFASASGASSADLSYPNAGLGGAAGSLGPALVVGAAKSAQQPDFDGAIDELRAWSVARTSGQILASYERALPVANAGLVGAWRCEEGAGAFAADTSGAGSPSALFGASAPAWLLAAQDPANVALVSPGALPPGFAQSVALDALVEPTAFRFLPDGRALIAERSGRVRLYAAGALVAQPVLELPAETSSAERGLATLVLDPDFAANGWFYCYWTTHAPRNRVSRFTLVGASAALASEFVVWECPTPALFFHHGGGLAIDASGHLYIATGEHFLSSLAQDLSVQIGKLLRVNTDGSIPADNPLAAQGPPQDALWGAGLRNPFRMHYDAPSGALWLGDVGGNGASAWEELALVGAPADYGWPWQEGETCWLGPGACTSLAFPALAYRHDEDLDANATPGGAIVCGPLVRSSAFPLAYRNQLYCGDFARGEIRRVLLDGSGAPTTSAIFLRAPHAGTVVDLDVGPDGALWYLVYGVPVGGPPEPAQLRRIAYVGVAAAPPLAVASAQPASGMPPLAVQFSSQGSLDPQPGPAALSFAWEFGDGAVSSAADPLHVYASAGLYTARLTVSDGAASTTSAPLSIQVGAPPQVQVLAPAPLSPYVAGQLIDCAAQAQDIEDGALAPSAFEWRVLLQHDVHAHPFLGPVAGTTTLQFQIPKTGHSPAHTHYVVQLTVTDSDGLATVVEVPLEPIESLLAIDTAPSGVPVFVDGEAFPTPLVLESLQGFEHQLSALPSWSGFGAPLAFACWSDGGAANHVFTAPVGGASATAAYAAPGQSCASADCGYASYGSALGAQALALLGIGAPQPAAAIELRVVGLGSGAIAWLGISAQPAAWPLFGGVLLVDPGMLVYSTALAASSGSASWHYTLPAALAPGAEAFVQSAALDPSVSGGVAFSAGLRVEICP
ncbi:MAG: PKD domain-containing protein [Planctomycetota bacterium]|nr:MAG: PKD domain-containing protein [Planctomycetota bacterium]